jgi:hypothetical protein
MTAARIARIGLLPLAALAMVIASPALATFPHEEEVPQDTREFFVDETKLPFDEVPGFPSTRSWGIDDGAGYRIEVPANWNGDLVVYTHGFRGNGAELTVDNPPLRLHLLANGYAWLASSYSKNYYDVRSGVESTNSLVRHFVKNVAEPDRTFITGFSMGGHVIGAAIEMFPNVECKPGFLSKLCKRLVVALGKLSGGIKYDGAAPFCGVMGDEALFDYFGDFGFAANTLAGVTSQFPPPPDYFDTIFLPTLNALYLNPAAVLTGNGSTANVNAQGARLRTLTTVMSGGPRPLADTAFRFYQQLLFSFGGSDGTIDGVVAGNLYDNVDRVYQLDADPAQSADEVAFNDAIIRIAQDPAANPPQILRVSRIPIIRGTMDIPVVSTHTTGDLFVPFVMQQIYAREAAETGHDHNLVSRATRAIGHCEFSPQELIETFDDMVEWVDTGVRPGGDDILDPAVVAAPLFGCNYSRGTTATRPLAPCP